MKFKSQTLLLIAAAVVLLFIYVNIERFTTTITIPDPPKGPPGPAGPPGPPGPGAGSTSSTPAPVASAHKSIKGAEFAKLTPTMRAIDRWTAVMKDSQAAAAAIGVTGREACTKKGEYTSECKVTGFCYPSGYCDPSPEDIIAYGLPDPTISPETQAANYFRDHPGSEWLNTSSGNPPKCTNKSECTTGYCDRLGRCGISPEDWDKYGFR